MSFPRYGGAGIGVCLRWRTVFEIFVADVGPPPSREHELDRIRPARGYSPSNVRWVLRRENAEHRATTRVLDGRTIREWSIVTGLPAALIRKRLSRGWPTARALGLDTPADVPF